MVGLGWLVYVRTDYRDSTNNESHSISCLVLVINSLAWIIELSFLAMISFIVATPIGKDAISSNSSR
jgi:Na+-transporting NADH:ubiquinone oxidoreductase subunit NqrE